MEMQDPRRWPSARFCPNCKNYAQVTWGKLVYLNEEAFEEAKFDTVRRHWQEFHSLMRTSSQWVMLNPHDSLHSATTGTEAMLVIGRCLLCKKPSVHSMISTLLWPTDEGEMPSANPDMPPEIRDYYEEARLTAARSPRSSMMLLRCCVEALLSDDRGYSGALYSRIDQLGEQGGSRQLLRALDFVRQLGNYAVHPSGINFDNAENLGLWFTLVNRIVEDFYSRDVLVEEAYCRLQDLKGDAK